MKYLHHPVFQDLIMLMVSSSSVYFQVHVLFFKPISSCSLPSIVREALVSLLCLRIFHRTEPLYLQPALLWDESVIFVFGISVSFPIILLLLGIPGTFLRG